MKTINHKISTTVPSLLIVYIFASPKLFLAAAGLLYCIYLLCLLFAYTSSFSIDLELLYETAILV